MSRRSGYGTDFFRDAQLHNPWWVDDLAELEAVSELEARSNTHKLLESLDGSVFGDSDRRVFPQYGQSGVGKTTTLKQIVATCLDDPSIGIDTARERTDREPLRIVDGLDPEQVLYVPVEDSGYHLTTTAGGDAGRAALDRLGETIERFTRRHGDGRELILIDDLGVLDLTAEERAEALLRFADDGTAIVVTGTLPGHVSFPDDADGASFAYAQLPRKFVDVAKRGGSPLAETVHRHQTDESEGLIHAVRDRLANPHTDRPDGGLRAVVEGLESLYFDVFDRSDRRELDRMAQRYLEHGGFFYDTDGDGTGVREAIQANELVETSLQLFLYRDVAAANAISSPRNLHRVCAFAARRHDEYRFKDLADWLDVDRRTVKDRYLHALDEATVLNPAPDYSLVRQHRTRLQLQNPRHAIILSQRQEHRGFEPTYRRLQPEPEFEGLLARTAAFDHAMRLQFAIGASDSAAENAERQVEYTRTDEGIVDAILRHARFVYPVALAYERRAEEAVDALEAFDPSSGKHRAAGDEGGRSIETVDLEYTAPVRFVVDDSLPYELASQERLVEAPGTDGPTVCHLPLWLFLLIG